MDLQPEPYSVDPSLKDISDRVEKHATILDAIRQEISRVIVGQDYMVERLLIALLSNGHILLEGMPGLAKTLAIKTLAQTLSLDFNRIQFTPDLLPADITGTMIYNHQTASFMVKKGPVFANLILADEINRAPPKVQAALLEAMQERQVTIGEQTYRLPDPFMVMATQNPIEQEGTYPLPEAQVDRFMMKVIVTYPDRETERKILRLNLKGKLPEVKPVCSASDIIEIRETSFMIYMDERVENYILDIIFATREPEQFGLEHLVPYIQYGVSPRGTIFLAQASRAFALLNHRPFVLPDDVRAVVADVLRHRIGLTYEAEAENITSDKIIAEILRKIEVP